MSSALLFGSTKRTVPAPAVAAERPWTVIIADDEPSVHDVTVLALDGFHFDGRAVKLVHAYSGAEALTRVAEHPEAAAILLDVVMETEHAGLEVARAIRETMFNRAIRVVLRTGQPGVAPESEVIAKYDINDYKEKSELTARRLYTVIFACLRAYRDISDLERAERGLEQVATAAPALFALSNPRDFAKDALDQLADLLRREETRITPGGGRNGVVARVDDAGDYRIIGAIGRFEGSEGKRINEVLPPLITSAVHHRGDDVAGSSGLLEIYPGPDGRERLIFIEGIGALGRTEKQVLSIFCRNVGIAFDNLHLKERIEATRQEVVLRLAESAETRAGSGGHHVRRIGEGCAILAAALALPATDVDLIREAAPLHDLGEIAIPDNILAKSSALDPDERQILERHCAVGHHLLEGTEQPILDAAATIALSHHERWDGNGYPAGRQGEEIPLYGRICTVIDVFDALSSRRPYREAWELQDILAHFRAESGGQFDPILVDLLFTCLDDLIALRDRYPDSP